MHEENKPLCEAELCEKKATVQVREIVEVDPVVDNDNWREFNPGDIHQFCDEHERQWNTLDRQVRKRMVETFVNTTTESPKEVDLESISNICSDLHKGFINSFVGLPVKVDESLEGSQYYIAVSRELLREIEGKR
jgi:hypothetical protein